MNSLRYAAGCALLASGMIALSGCAATSDVQEITEVPAGAAVSGVPFRIAEPYKVRLFQLTPAGQYKEVYTAPQILPDQDRIFAVTFKGGSFSDHEFKIELNDDNTIKTSHLKSVKHGGEAVNALADQASAVATAIKADKTAGKTEKVAQQTAEQTYLDLKGKADIAIAAYAAALEKEDASAVDIVTAKAAMDLAKKKANDAAVNLGLPIPYNE